MSCQSPQHACINPVVSQPYLGCSTAPQLADSGKHSFLKKYRLNSYKQELRHGV